MPRSDSALPLPRPDLRQVLSRPLLDLLDLPPRVASFAYAEGLETIGDLARIAPEDLLAERNLGRKSVTATRRILEARTGVAWEEIACSGPPQAANDGPGSEPDPQSWDAVRAGLTDEQRRVLLDDLDIPGHLRLHLERHGVTTLGDLATWSRAQLLAVPRVGRGIVTKLPERVTARLAELAAEAMEEERPLYEALANAIEDLDAKRRFIARARSGIDGEPLVLGDIGSALALCRERVRQLETDTARQMRRRGWAKRAARRVDEALAEGPVPLTVLASEPWWATACERPAVIAFVVEHVLDAAARVIELDGHPWLSRRSRGEIDELWSSLLRAAERVALPAALADLDALLVTTLARIGPCRYLTEHFREKLHGLLQVDARSDRVLAIGATQHAEIVAMLRDASAPMRIDDLAERLGIKRLNVEALPEEVIHFAHGTIGLREHFRDFDAWRATLVPAAVHLIETSARDRQWHCAELLAELACEHDIPEWLTPYGLGALIRAGDELRYLGRLRVALHGSVENESRVLLHEAVERVLEETGRPQPIAEVVAKVRERVGAPPNAVHQAFKRSEFVRFDRQHIGLRVRDVPGGEAAIIAATDHVHAVLVERGRGLSAFHLYEEVRRLGAIHREWPREMTASVFVSDPRFQSSRGTTFGLAEWESTRVPTRREIVRKALDEGNGEACIADLNAAIEADYGERPSRKHMGVIARDAGASVAGERIVVHTAPTPAP